MIAAPEHPQEAARNRCIEMLGLHQLDAGGEFNDVLALLSSQLSGWVSLFSVVYHDQQLFHGNVGFAASPPSRAESFCAHAIISGQRFFEIPDTSRDRRFAENRHGIGSYAGVVINAPNGLPIGTVCVAHEKPRALSTAQRDALTKAARVVKSMVRYRSESGIDELTQLANRRSFNKNLEIEWQRVQHRGSRIGIIMLDIDNFKLINDGFGHDAGDGCLTEIATALAAQLTQPGDLVARYGGEEFIAICLNSSPSALVERANKLRVAVGKQPIDVIGNTAVSLSAGAALLSPHPNDASSPEAAIHRADQSLLRAKTLGRNTVVLHGQQRMPLTTTGQHAVADE